MSSKNTFTLHVYYGTFFYSSNPPRATLNNLGFIIFPHLGLSFCISWQKSNRNQFWTHQRMKTKNYCVCLLRTSFRMVATYCLWNIDIEEPVYFIDKDGCIYLIPIYVNDWSVIYCFTLYLDIFHSYGNVTIQVKGCNI